MRCPPWGDPRTATPEVEALVRAAVYSSRTTNACGETMVFLIQENGALPEVFHEDLGWRVQPIRYLKGVNVGSPCSFSVEEDQWIRTCWNFSTDHHLRAPVKVEEARGFESYIGPMELISEMLQARLGMDCRTEAGQQAQMRVFEIAVEGGLFTDVEPDEIPLEETPKLEAILGNL